MKEFSLDDAGGLAHRNAAIIRHRTPREPQTKKRTKRDKNFTTAYAKEWGKRQGWKLRNSEGTNILGHSFDIGPGADAEFETPDGFVYVQGAGRHEKAPHFQRFEERGGVPFCRKRNAQFFYLEFERGDKTPVLVEQWA